MPRKKQQPRSAPLTGRFEFNFQVLEERRLLSGTDLTVTPDLILTPDRHHSASITGYSPGQIAQAYGFNQITFDGTAGTGSGQTIALIDAYNDPDISSDLSTFDSTFNLDSANLTVVNQSGGSVKSVSSDAGWAGETSLDVEWAHAMAPGAKILLVEANSDSLNDLISAVDYAKTVSSVSVISMSWGSGEFSSETSYDSTFTTPSGHQGITYVASAGDDGSWWGPEWPASSSNVLSVGGTTLSTRTKSGTYSSETGWDDGGGGTSAYEATPGYQSAVASGGRSTPDVSYDADPDSGFAVYDSVPYEGYVGWQEVGGTSAGAPQWSALVAIANQGRTLQGESTLNGATQTLPTLYSLYTSSTAYASSFHDVTSGASSRSVQATTGYDQVSGLGTPQAQTVVSTLVGGAVTSTASTGSTTTHHHHHTASSAEVIAQPTPSPTPASPQALAAMSLLQSDSSKSSSAATPTALIADAPGASHATAGPISFTSLTSPLATAIQTPQMYGIGTEVVSHLATGSLASWKAAADVAPALAHTLLSDVAAMSRAPMQFLVPHLDALASFDDGLIAFADECAGITPASVPTAGSSNFNRAWALTAGVVAVDVILLGHWYAQRRAKKIVNKVVDPTPFNTDVQIEPAAGN